MELTQLSALKQAELIHNKEITAVEMLNAVLQQVKSTDDKVHAFVTLAADEAMKKAQDVDRRIAAGLPVGALAGVPYAVSDSFCTKDLLTTAGSKICEGWLPTYNAAIVDKMDAADAVLFGKTNCDDLGIGVTGETSVHKPVACNPKDAAKVPGDGAAAAIAANEGALAWTSDPRLSAAYCGTVGLKPTFGRVSRRGVVANDSSIDVLGPVARNVSDVAYALSQVAGQDTFDNVSATLPVEDYLSELAKGVKGMRVGISPDLMALNYLGENGEYVTTAIKPEVKAAVEKTAETLASLGAEIVYDVPMPNAKYASCAAYPITCVEGYTNLQRFAGLVFGHSTSRRIEDMYDMYFKNRGEGFSFDTKLEILTGLFVSMGEYYEKYLTRAQKVRAQVRRDQDIAFDPNGKYALDILLTPAAPSTAFALGEVFTSNCPYVKHADEFMLPFAFSGRPAITFPVATAENGLPIAVQAVGNDYCESAILRAAYAIEQTGH